MTTPDTCVTIVPYFNVSDENLPAFKNLCVQFVEKTKSEPGCLFYGFSFSGNSAHCREGYSSAEAALAHLENVGTLLGEALKVSEIDRLEIHGPSEELAKLKEPLSDLNPRYYTIEYSFRN